MTVLTMKTDLEAKIVALNEKVTAIKAIQTEGTIKVSQLTEQQQALVTKINLINDEKCACVDLEQLQAHSEAIEGKQKELKSLDTLINNNKAVTENTAIEALDELISAHATAKALFNKLDVTMIPETAFNEIKTELAFMEQQHRAISLVWSFITNTINKYNKYTPLHEGGTQLNHNMYTKLDGSVVHLSGLFAPSKLLYLVKHIEAFERAEGITLL